MPVRSAAVSGRLIACENSAVGPSNIQHKTYKPKVKPEQHLVRDAVDLIAGAKRPVFYTGGGVINSGPKASQLLRELVRLTGYPVTSTLMDTANVVPQFTTAAAAGKPPDVQFLFNGIYYGPAVAGRDADATNAAR